MSTQDRILFFVALVPPEDHHQKYQVIKDHLTREFGTKAAQKSPPHITLIPPFRLRKDQEEILESSIKASASQFKPFEIEVNGYGRFDSRVIFAHPIPSKQLQECRRRSLSNFEKSFPKLLNLPSRPFHPHITLAFKDLDESHFNPAWESLKTKPLEDRFQADKLSILKLKNGIWEIGNEYSFGG